MLMLMAGIAGPVRFPGDGADVVTLAPGTVALVTGVTTGAIIGAVTLAGTVDGTVRFGALGRVMRGDAGVVALTGLVTLMIGAVKLVAFGIIGVKDGAIVGVLMLMTGAIVGVVALMVGVVTLGTLMVGAIVGWLEVTTDALTGAGDMV
jgi:hypothetical protein